MVDIIQRDIGTIVREYVGNYYALATFYRHIPDIRDGMKLSVRRLSYALHSTKKYGNNAPFGKSTTIVASMMDLHPHGDSSCYNLIVSQARWWVTNHCMITPDSAFGNQIGDPAAAMRYTNCKGSQFYTDVTVPFIRDECLPLIRGESDSGSLEPEYIPTAVPMLLVNGATGIAVGFTTDIPSHNLSETIDRCIMYIKNKNISNPEITKNYYPDYALGCTILNGNEVAEAYATGTNNVTINIKADIHIDRENNKIQIFNLPPGTDWSLILKQIAAQTEKNHTIISKINGKHENSNLIKGRIIFELLCDKNSDLDEIVDYLLELTDLKTRKNNNIIFRVINERTIPITVTVLDIIREWYKVRYAAEHSVLYHRQQKRVYEKHIQEGLYHIFPILDEVVDMIKNSTGGLEEIKKNLMGYGLTEIQSEAIATMELRKISKRGESQIKAEIDRLTSVIDELDMKILTIDKIIIESLRDIKSKHGRERMTKVLAKEEERSGVSIGQGYILYNNNTYNICDANNLINNRNIISGMKNIRINGVNTKEIYGIDSITKKLDSVIIIYSNNIARRISKIEFINNWELKQDDEMITSILPVYSDNDLLLMINNDFKIKMVKSSDFGNVKVSLGKSQVIACKNVTGAENIIIMDDKTNYCYLDMIDSPIPLVSRTAVGNNTKFKNKKLYIEIVDGMVDNIMSLSFNNDDHGYIINYPIESLTNNTLSHALKTLIKNMPEDSNISGISFLDNTDKEAINILIGKDNTAKLNKNIFKELENPIKTGIKTLKIVQIKI